MRQQRRFRFDASWALIAIVIGIIFSLAANVGSGQRIDIEFLAAGAFMGLCIYAANILLHSVLSPWVSMCSAPVKPPLRVAVSIVAAIIGWTFGYIAIGFLESGRFVVPNVFGKMRWLLVISMALTVLIALVAGGYNELRDRLSESIKAEQELEVARSIQSRLLPPPRVEGEGYVITARNVPALYVAGDFYDVLPHEDGSIGIVIADVAGKGIGASLIMATVKAVLPFVANGSVDATLRALNERLIGQLAPREFVALAYARFHPATGLLQLANAGMPDPYVIGSDVVPIAVQGERLPLGLRRDVLYESAERRLQPGDRLVLLSDGIPEAPTPSGEQLGYDALRKTLANVDSIDTMIERVRAQVSRVDDDWTVVMLERR